MDFSGNNAPLSGGTYNPDGVTMSDALSTATPPLPPTPVTRLTPTSPAASTGAAAPAAGQSEQTIAIASEQLLQHQQVQHHHHWDFA